MCPIEKNSHAWVGKVALIYTLLTLHKLTYSTGTLAHSSNLCELIGYNSYVV